MVNLVWIVQASKEFHKVGRAKGTTKVAISIQTIKSEKRTPRHGQGGQRQGGWQKMVSYVGEVGPPVLNMSIARKWDKSD